MTTYVILLVTSNYVCVTQRVKWGHSPINFRVRLPHSTSMADQHIDGGENVFALPRSLFDTDLYKVFILGHNVRYDKPRLMICTIISSLRCSRQCCSTSPTHRQHTGSHTETRIYYSLGNATIATSKLYLVCLSLSNQSLAF